VKRALSFLVTSWMGLLFMAVGLGGINVADHLMLVYPLPMALMLMAVGAIVFTNVTQDMTQLGGLWKKRPLMGVAFLTGWKFCRRLDALRVHSPGGNPRACCGHGPSVQRD
jgi:NAD(P)H-quinone oxidoreductase subunit 5